MAKLRAEAVPKPSRRRRGLGSSIDDRTADHSGRSVRPLGPLPSRAPQTPSAALSGLRVVVVDDDHDTLDYFTVALRTYGAVVAAASNALDALQLIHDGPLDIVLSDIAMPDHDGYWLVRELRESSDPQLREVPVIATTAYGSEHPRRRALRAGFSEHLPKPVDPIVLRDTIARLVGR
jgi:CheY-like chemotaxis protein